MKPVLIQTLFKRMRDRVRLPDPLDNSAEPQRRDRTGSILIAIVVIAFIIVLLV